MKLYKVINIIESHSSITNRLLLKNELATLAILRLAYLKIEEDTDLKENLHKMIINVIIYPFLKQLFASKGWYLAFGTRLRILMNKLLILEVHKCLFLSKEFIGNHFAISLSGLNTYIRFPLMLHGTRKTYN